MMLAGGRVEDRLVLHLAGMLRDAGLDGIAERLEDAYHRDVTLLALTIEERDCILEVLMGDCPDGLGELRAVGD